MSTKIVWRPLHLTPEHQLALDSTGHEVGTISQIADIWVARYADRRIQCLSEAEAKAWVEEQLVLDAKGLLHAPEPMRPTWLWLSLCVAFALMTLAVGCAATPKEPLPHYPCWDKKAQEYIECSGQEWMYQVITKELP